MWIIKSKDFVKISEWIPRNQECDMIGGSFLTNSNFYDRRLWIVNFVTGGNIYSDNIKWDFHGISIIVLRTDFNWMISNLGDIHWWAVSTRSYGLSQWYKNENDYFSSQRHF